MGRVIEARRVRLVLVLLAASVIACRGRAEGEGAFAREVAVAIPRIESATGLTFKTPPKVEARSREQVREFLVRKFNEETPAQELAGDLRDDVLRDG